MNTHIFHELAEFGIVEQFRISTNCDYRVTAYVAAFRVERFFVFSRQEHFGKVKRTRCLFCQVHEQLPKSLTTQIFANND